MDFVLHPVSLLGIGVSTSPSTNAQVLLHVTALETIGALEAVVMYIVIRLLCCGPLNQGRPPPMHTTQRNDGTNLIIFKNSIVTSSQVSVLLFPELSSRSYSFIRSSNPIWGAVGPRVFVLAMSP